MPSFTVTMKANRSAKEKDRLSRTIHAESVVVGYPEDDLFQRFLSLDPSDLRWIRNILRCPSPARTRC